MKQLSSNLHTENAGFKKQFLKISLLLFFTVPACINANAQCAVNPVANQLLCNNTATTAISFTGTATTFNWVNNTASIGLAASGAGNIASFTALNTSALAVTATITVTPSSGACTGTPISFTITVNPSPVVNVTPLVSCGGNAGTGGPCIPLTASGNADFYVWSPIAGLYNNCTLTAPYTGTNLAAVYAGPTSNTTYTVTGTIAATGCTNTATALVNYTPPAPIVMPSAVSMCIGDPAVKLRIASGTGVAQFCSGIVNIPAPDNNQAGAFSSINVTGVPACNLMSIAVTINMPHTRIGDMVFVLKAPNGNVINLDYFLTGSQSSNLSTGFNNTVFSGIGTAFLINGSDPYTGMFRADLINTPLPNLPTGPTGMLSTATNWFQLFSVPNGTWTLGFYDGVTGEVGTLTSWCLGINYSCPAVPASP